MESVQKLNFAGRQQLTAWEYANEQRNQIRQRQYLQATEPNSLMPYFLKTLRMEDKCTLKYYRIWLKFKLDDFSREVLPPYHSKIREKRRGLSDSQKKKIKLQRVNCKMN